MISSNDFRNGVTVEMDGDAWQVIDFQHVKPGKGAAFVRAKMKNIRTGAVVERTFNAGEKLARAHLDNRQMQFLYESDGAYNFMDNENFEQNVHNIGTIGNRKIVSQGKYEHWRTVLSRRDYGCGTARIRRA